MHFVHTLQHHAAVVAVRQDDSAGEGGKDIPLREDIRGQGLGVGVAAVGDLGDLEDGRGEHGALVVHILGMGFQGRQQTEQQQNACQHAAHSLHPVPSLCPPCRRKMAHYTAKARLCSMAEAEKAVFLLKAAQEYIIMTYHKRDYYHFFE